MKIIWSAVSLVAVSVLAVLLWSAATGTNSVEVVRDGVSTTGSPAPARTPGSVRTADAAPREPTPTASERPPAAQEDAEKDGKEGAAKGTASPAVPGDGGRAPAPEQPVPAPVAPAPAPEPPAPAPAPVPAAPAPAPAPPAQVPLPVQPAPPAGDPDDDGDDDSDDGGDDWDDWDDD